jgi:TPR repeat protein
VVTKGEIYRASPRLVSRSPNTVAWVVRWLVLALTAILSGLVAVATSGPLLGIATLLVAGWGFTWSVKRFQRWVYTSGSLAGGSPDPTPQEAEARLRAAAGEGDAEAMYHLFLLMLQADRLAEAQEWNRRAAEAGHVAAMATYGALLADRGDEAGALDWYRRAAEAGNVDAAYNLAGCAPRRGRPR